MYVQSFSTSKLKCPEDVVAATLSHHALFWRGEAGRKQWDDLVSRQDESIDIHPHRPKAYAHSVERSKSSIPNTLGLVVN